MNKLKIFIEGFIIGLGKIMPGVSGSVMAICFGVYERLIACLSSLKNLKSDFKFFILIALGIGISIIIGSNIIKYFLDSYFLYTLSFFIGMMSPGIFPLLKEIKNEDITYKRVMICIMVFAGLIIINAISITGVGASSKSGLQEFISLILCGLIDAASTIIPGISGSALLMLIGYYDKIIYALANVFTIESIFTLIPFGIGMIIGIILISKLITYLFKTKRIMTIMLIVTFAVFSIIALLIKSVPLISTPFELLASTIFLIIGLVVALFLEKAFSSN